MNFEEKVIGLLESLNTKVDALDSRVAVIEADVAELKTDVAELKTKMTELDSRVAVIETGMGRLQADVAQLQTGMGRLQADVAQLQTGMGRLQADVGRLQTDVAQLQITAEDNTMRLRKLSQEVWRQSDMLIDFKGRLILHETDHTQRFVASLDGWKNSVESDTAIKEELYRLDKRVDFIERQKFEDMRKELLAEAATA